MKFFKKIANKKAIKLTLFIFLFAVFTFDTGAQDSYERLLNVKLLSKYKDDVLLYHNDEFRNSQGILYGDNIIKDATYIVDSHWKHQIIYYIPSSIKHIEIKLIDGYYYFNSKNLEINDIINFDVSFRKNFDPITDYESFNKKTNFSNPSYYNNGNKRNSDIDRKIENKLIYLKAYAKSKNMNIQKFHDWQKVIQFEGLKYKLNIVDYAKWDINYLKNLRELKVNFNDTTNLDLQFYRESLNYYINLLLFIETNRIEQNMHSKWKIIEKNFNGITRDYLLCNLLLESKDKDSQIVYKSDDYNALLKNFLSNCKTPKFLHYIQKSNKVITGSGSLLKYNDSTSDIKEIVANHKLNYIDFWASWCAPCRAEMPDSKKLKSEYKRRGINFIYISIDENSSAWQRASNQLGLSTSESFMLNNSKENMIKKKFNIKAIPRYIIVDNNGKVINIDAPRPSSQNIKTLFENLISNPK